MKRISVFVVSILAVGMSGCSWLNPGEEEFACSGMPGSVFCHSAREVYERTNSGLVPSPINGHTYNEKCTDCVRAEDENLSTKVDEDGINEDPPVKPKKVTKTLDVLNDEMINNYVTPNLPTRPVPVRTPAQIMRIWVGPYVDRNGDLVAPGIVYTEIEPRKWIYPSTEGTGGAINNRVMRPLAEASQYEGGIDPTAYLKQNRNGQQPQNIDEFSALKRFGKGQQTIKSRLGAK